MNAFRQDVSRPQARRRRRAPRINTDSRLTADSSQMKMIIRDGPWDSVSKLLGWKRV